MIHVTIGSSLDSMTSAADFHILSVRNVLGLCAVGVAVLIPTGLKRVFRKDLGDLGEAEAVFEGESIDTREVEVPAIDNGEPRRYQAIDSGVVLAGPSTGDPNLDIGGKVNKGKGRAVEIIADIRDDDEGHYTVYDVEQPHVAAEKVRPQKAYVPIQEYGAIETVGREPAEVGKWWPISRS